MNYKFRHIKASLPFLLSMLLLFVSFTTFGNNDIGSFDIYCPPDLVLTNDADVCGAVVTFPDAYASTNTPPATPTGFTYQGTLNGKYYYLSDAILMDYDAANTAAMAINGTIVVINDQAENDFVQNIGATNNEDPIIGASDVVTEGVFLTAEGNPLPFSQWNPTEPNNAGALGENHVFLSRWNGNWFDIPISVNNRRYVIEVAEDFMITQTAGMPSGSTFPLGVSTIEYTATDGANTLTCSFSITITDTQAPAFNCPADTTIAEVPGECGAVYVFDVPVIENCPGAVVTQTDGTGLVSGDVFPPGITTLSYLVTDAAGLTATCSFGVNITTTGYLPQINNCPADIVASTGVGICDTVITWDEPTLNETCAPLPPAGFTYSGEYNGSHYFLSDDNMTDYGLAILQAATVGGTLVVINDQAENDYVQSIANVHGINVNIGLSDVLQEGTFIWADGTPLTYSNWFVNEPNNNGGIEDYVIMYFNAGTWNDVPIDVRRYIIEVPNTMTLNQTQGPPSGSTFPVGTTNIEYVASDALGNESTCAFTVTVADNEFPELVCQDITVQLDAMGNASIQLSDVNTASSDNCGIADVVIDQTDFDCTMQGDNTVTVTATDVNGNVTTCTPTVTVADASPMAMCQDLNLVLDATGNTSITVADIDNGSSALCGIASMTISQMDFNCSHFGDNAVTLTVTDNVGNVATCIATVNIQEELPEVTCRNITLQLDDTGNASITTDSIVDSVVAICGVASLTLSQTDFSCSDFGDNSIVVTLTDDAGNVATCTAIVTVPEELPEVMCKNITVALDDAGMASISISDIDDGTTAICGIASSTISKENFTCDDIGENVVTYTITDGVGTTASCTAMVTVESNIFCEPKNIAIPTAFSPNADGKNDVFDVLTSGIVEVKEFKVFNRWGQLMHNNISQAWDGTRNGEPQPQDTYIYMVVGMIEGEEIVYKGEVVLLR